MRSISPKIFRRTLWFSAVALFLFWYTANLWVERKLPFIEGALAKALGHPVAVEKAHYDLFRGFVLEGVEVKQNSPQLPAYRAERVWAAPAFQLFPEPAIWIHRLTLDSPEVRLRAKIEEIFKMGSALKNTPELKSKIGLLTVGLKLKSFAIERGHLSLLSSVPGEAWRQDFENVRFFAGDGWFRRNHVEFGGHIAAKPEAYFRIRLDAKRGGGGKAMDSNLTLDFHEFTTAYIAPHLKDLFRLPERDLTASAKFNVRDGKDLKARGKILLPEIASKKGSWNDLLRRPSELRFSVDGLWEDGLGTFDTIKFRAGGIGFRGSGAINTRRGHELYEASLASEEMPLSRLQSWLSPMAVDSGTVRMKAALRGDTRVFDPSLHLEFKNCALREKKAGLSLSGLGGSVIWSNSRMSAKDLWAFVNDIPVAVDGEFVRDKRDSFRVRLSTYPGQFDHLKKVNPLLVSFEAVGMRMAKGWSGRVTAEVPAASENSKPMTTTVSFHRLMPAKDHLWKAGAVRWKNGKDLLFRKPTVYLRSDGSRLEAELTDALWGGGRLTGRGEWDLTTQTWKAEAGLTGAKTREILSDFQCDYPLNGSLFAQAAWAGRLAKGSMDLQFRITDGAVGPGASLERWAAQTGIAALSHIRFKKFSGRLQYDEGVWDMRDLELDADQAYLSARLKAQPHRISGDMHVRFPASLVAPATDLKWLMDFVNVGEWVDFNFKVSSNYRTARVEWIGGQFKEQVESKLAPWMRTELERQVLKKISEQSDTSKTNILDNPNAKAYADKIS